LYFVKSAFHKEETLFTKSNIWIDGPVIFLAKTQLCPYNIFKKTILLNALISAQKNIF